MIKNTFILAIATIALGAVSAQAATVNGTNYSLDSVPPVHKPITVGLAGTPLTTGGVIQIGSFTSADPASLIAGLTSPAGLQALLADFITFGSSASVGGLGAGFEGIYDVVAQAPIGVGSPLIDKPIYTLIGNNATLANSDHLAIVRDNQSFAADAPLFVAGASLLETTNVYLFGSDTGPIVTTNTAFPAAASLQLAAVPEPMSAALLLSSLGLLIRRRRA